MLCDRERREIGIRITVQTSFLEGLALSRLNEESINSRYKQLLISQ